MRSIVTGGRIVLDAAAYRIQKREAGNLVTSMTLALALALPASEIAVRLAFGVVLNLFVYLVNDCFDVEVDLAAPGRDAWRTRYLGEHLREGIGACVALAVAMLAAALAHGHGLVVTLLVNVVVILAYSAKLKRTPIFDVIIMAVWGVSMAMVGFPPSSSAGWRFAALLGVMCAVTEAVQVLRDHDSDAAAGVRTTAVVLGPRRTAILAKTLVVGAAAYTALALDAWLALPLLAAAVPPLDPPRAARSWDWIRAVFGLTWLALLAHYALASQFTGLLAR